MNYYLPFNSIPYETQGTGILSRIFRNGINWSTIFTNTQKTLNIINQTIPVIKQVKPVVNNAKTMFKVMNEFKKVDVPEKKSENITANNTKPTNKISNNTNNTNNTNNYNNTNNPTFFL